MKLYVLNRYLTFLVCRLLGLGLVRSKYPYSMAIHLTLTRSIGSTVPYVVERIVKQGAEANKNRVFIPTGLLLHN